MPIFEYFDRSPVGVLDLNAALDYFGSDKARIDFINNDKGGQIMFDARQRCTSAIDYLEDDCLPARN